MCLFGLQTRKKNARGLFLHHRNKQTAVLPAVLVRKAGTDKLLQGGDAAIDQTLVAAVSGTYSASSEYAGP
jgi:hypothetical protein